VLVSAMHITASIFVNDHESGLWHDILHWLEETVAPWSPERYRHNDTGEDNAAAHLRSLTIGHEVIVPSPGRARPRPLAAGVLWRVGRPAPEAGDRQGAGGVAAQQGPPGLPVARQPLHQSRKRNGRRVTGHRPFASPPWMTNFLPAPTSAQAAWKPRDTSGAVGPLDLDRHLHPAAPFQDEVDLAPSAVR